MRILLVTIVILLFSPFSNLAKPMIVKWHGPDGSVEFSQTPPAHVGVFGTVSLNSGAITLVDAAGENLGYDGTQLNDEVVNRYFAGNWRSISQFGTINMTIAPNGQVVWIELPAFGPSILRRGRWELEQRSLIVICSHGQRSLIKF